MSRKSIAIIYLVAALVWATALASTASAEQPPPYYPACLSWIPHGYGSSMHVINGYCTRQKTLYGFRTAPEHTGAWAQPLWGWDVNGYYRGPQVPEPDPCECQLPIGLIYPENGPMIPDPRLARKLKRIHAQRR